MKFFYLIMASFLILACTKTQLISSRPDSNYGFSVLQGSTTNDSTIIRIVYPKALKVNYQVHDSQGQLIPVKKTISISKEHSEFKVDHISVSSLKLKETYTLKINSDVKKWNDQRTFQALDIHNDQLNILVASCMSDTYNDIGNDIWPKAFAHNPDVTFLIGDNIYADTFSGIYLGSSYLVKPEHLWRRHVDHAMKLKVYRMKHLTPTYVTWDDHDYGKNDGGLEYPFKNKSRKMFNLFFPRQNAANFSYGPGLSTQVELGKMNFLFLDGRSFRSPRTDKAGAHFGKSQRKWINNNLQKDKLNWLISGDQFFGGYHPFESFEGNHTETFKKFLNDIKLSKSKSAFLSGDRHLLEIMKIPADKIGHETLEFTVSGIQTKMYPGSLKRDPNPLRIGGFDGRANYAIIKTKVNKDKVDITLEGYSRTGIEVSTSHKL